MKNVNTKKLVLTAAITSALTACGGTGQDGGNGSSANQTFSGKAIDGYVARAQVFLDTNNNGTRDAWEPQAFTDNDGYFGRNPDTQTDYCADKASDLYQLHCLVSDTAYQNVVVRIKGGYDLSTGEPFLGQMSRRVESTQKGAVDSVLVTPLTSLLAEVEDSSDREKLLEALNIDKEDLDVDYFKPGDVNAKVLKKALNVHKAVTLLSNRLNETYDEMGKGFGVADDASGSVYKAFVEEVSKELESTPVASGQSDYIETLLASDTFLRNLLSSSEEKVKKVYEERKLDLPNQSVSQSSNINNLLNRAKALPSVTQALLDEQTPTQQQLTSLAKALETLVLKVSKDSQGSDASVDRAIDFYKKSGQERDKLLSMLEQPGADLNKLADSDFNFSPTTDFAQTFVNNTELPDIVNKTIRLSDDAEKYEVRGNNYKFKDSQIILYLQGEQGQNNGKVTACVKYIQDAKFDANAESGKQVKLGEANTTGEVITGQWTKLDARQLLVRAKYLGSDYQWLIKPKGDNRYQFDFDGDLTVWKADLNEGSESLSDIVIEDIPETNDECKSKLPLRLTDVPL